MASCPKCEAPAVPGDRFCSQCGERLEGSAPDEAAGSTQKSLSLSDVHYNLGLVYFKKEEYRKALESWERGLSKDPDNPILKQCIADARERLSGG